MVTQSSSTHNTIPEYVIAEALRTLAGPDDDKAQHAATIDCGAWNHVRDELVQARTVGGQQAAWRVLAVMQRQYPDLISLLAAQPTPSQYDERPVIDVSEIDLAIHTKQIWEAILASSEARRIVRIGSELMRIGDDSELQQLTETAWRGLINRIVRFVRRRGQNERSVAPPLELVRDSRHYVPTDIPVIERIARLPVFLPSGQLMLEGLDRNHRLLSLNTVQITPMPVHEALELILDNLLIDFPFATPGDLANALALLLAPFVRPMYRVSPFFLIDATTRGTGKGLLLDLFHYVWLGTDAELGGLPLQEEEQRKLITSLLLEAPIVAAFDELSYIGGQPLQRAITAATWVDRALGSNSRQTLPVTPVWVGAGNNCTLGGDMARRTLLIRLEAPEERPELRTGFKRSEGELRKWTRTNRMRLISACVALIQHGLAAPEPTNVPAFGGFEDFACLMTRILQANGIVGFLDNRVLVYDKEDYRLAGWKAVVQAWWEKHRNKPVPAAEIVKLIDTDPHIDIDVDGQSERARAISMGKLLKARLGVIFSLPNRTKVRIQSGKNERGHTVYWLDTVGQVGPTVVAKTIATIRQNNRIPHQDAIPEVTEKDKSTSATEFRIRTPSPKYAEVDLPALLCECEREREVEREQRAEIETISTTSATSATSATASECQKMTAEVISLDVLLRQPHQNAVSGVCQASVDCATSATPMATSSPTSDKEWQGDVVIALYDILGRGWPDFTTSAGAGCVDVVMRGTWQSVARVHRDDYPNVADAVQALLVQLRAMADQ